jgi:hypothetical protein
MVVGQVQTLARWQIVLVCSNHRLLVAHTLSHQSKRIDEEFGELYPFHSKQGDRHSLIFERSERSRHEPFKNPHITTR